MAGALALGGGAALQAGEKGEGNGRHGRGEHRMGGRMKLERLTKGLDLTPQQETQINPLLEQVKPQIKAIHEEAQQKAKAVMDDTMAKIRPLLTPEQVAKMDKMKAAREKMREARQEMREARQN